MIRNFQNRSQSIMALVFAFCFSSIALVLSLEDLVVLRHSPTDNDSTRKLTCLSEDNDDAALIWNYNTDENDADDKRNIFTNFQPKKPKSKKLTECAIWNSTSCHAQWGNMSGWEVVESVLRPTGPVFDYRWEGFEEFVSRKSTQHREYQYVGKVKESSGTAVFSVRGLRDIYIFLCERKEPLNGPCFWIIIGGWNGKRSAIRSCADGAPKARVSRGEENCVDVANVTHGAEGIVDAYAWRTFRLEWNSARNEIKIFNETELEPFLEGTVDQWLPVSHLSVQSELLSRFRFHFYEYLLTNKTNAVISTTEFTRYDENFCVELLVGLCPECKLNVTLIGSEGGVIPINTISGVENSVRDKLLTWRSVRLNATLPILNSSLVKLKMVAILTGNGVEGLWAIDNFHTCKSAAGLRESTITTHRETLDFSNPIWPVVKCQKLSYNGNTVVDSLPSTPYRAASRKHPFRVKPEGNRLTMNIRPRFKTGGYRAIDHHSIPGSDIAANNTEKVVRSEARPYAENNGSVSEISGGLLLKRKARSQVDESLFNASQLEIYRGDSDKNTISLRLSKLQPNVGGIDKYTVLINKTDEQFFTASKELECTLWENSVCFEAYNLPKNISLNAATIAKINCEVQGRKKNQLLHTWPATFRKNFWVEAPSMPLNLSLTEESPPGTVRVKWRHPWLPNMIVKRFEVHFVCVASNRIEGSLEVHDEEKVHPVEQEQKEYQMTHLLRTSSEYKISVTAINGADEKSEQIFRYILVSGAVAFNTTDKQLHQTNNGTSHTLNIPSVIDPTNDTWIRVIANGTLTCTRNESEPFSSFDNEIEWILKEYKVENDKPKNLTIDANKTDSDSIAPNCALQVGNTYKIEVEVIDRYSNKSDTLASAEFSLTLIDGVTFTAEVEVPNRTWIIILFIAMIFAVVLLFIFYRFRKHKPTTPLSTNELEIPSTGKSYSRTSAESPKVSSPSSDEPKKKPPTEQHPPDIVPYYNPHSQPVKVEEFEEYVKEGLTSGLLDSQYEIFSRGLTKPCDYGTLPENVPKNRYKNLTAYDETRVVLEKIPGDPYSDYINASYIKGYGNNKAYIATQGPKPKTVRDFWRMIWQEQVRVICMLANVTEGGKTKCEQYWPEVGCKLKYGDILVSNTGHEVFADYTLRTFKLGCQKVHREVAHLHYTGWPDHGVPMYTQSLVSYLKKLQETPTGNGPIVVHCSAGVGRTGTIILCDICLQQGLAEEVIDVPTAIIKMREDRANMVDSAQQYLLAHLTIVESMVPVPTQISCTVRLPEKIKELRKQLPFDIQRLNDTVWQDRVLHALAAPTRPSLKDVMNNEISEFNPAVPTAADSEVFSPFDGEYNDINAVSVDGVKMKKQYLAARLPSSATLSEFWKVIAEKRIELVVILQRPDPRDTKFCDIMPDESVLVPVPNLQVETKASLVEEEHFSVNKLLLTDTSTEKPRSQPVTVLTCTGWACRKEGKPPDAAALVLLWRASEKISRKESPTLVLCRDGVTGCGLYLALSFLLERMAVERECDVISAVRAVRRSRPEFVQLLKQFEYLYDAAVEYIKSFETYANFS